MIKLQHKGQPDGHLRRRKREAASGIVDDDTPSLLQYEPAPEPEPEPFDARPSRL